MSSPQMVNVHYRGLEVGTGLTLVEFGPTTAYLEIAQPMPVGTVLSIAVDGGVSFEAEVLRVREQVAGAEQAPGMRVRASALGDAQDWWQSQISVQDPVIPELMLKVDAVEEAAAPEQAAPEAAAPSSEAVAEQAPSESSAKHTAVMDVSEIQAVIAAGGDVAELLDSNGQTAAAVDARSTTEMPAVDVKAIEAEATASSEPAEDSKAEGKKKRKRRKRKTKGKS